MSEMLNMGHSSGFIRVPHCLEYRAQWDLSGEAYGKRAADAIEEVILAEGPDTVGGLCLEPVTAGGGVITPPKDTGTESKNYVKNMILLHIDEVAPLAEQAHGLDTKTMELSPIWSQWQGGSFWLCCYCMFSYHRGGV